MPKYANPKTKEEIIDAYNYLKGRRIAGTMTSANRAAFPKIKRLYNKVMNNKGNNVLYYFVEWNLSDMEDELEKEFCNDVASMKEYYLIYDKLHTYLGTGEKRDKPKVVCWGIVVIDKKEKLESFYEKWWNNPPERETIEKFDNINKVNIGGRTAKAVKVPKNAVYGELCGKELKYNPFK